MKENVIETTSGRLYITEDFNIGPLTSKEKMLSFFGKHILMVTPALDYTHGTIRNLKIEDWYFMITFYFDKERITRFSFIPNGEPFGEASWDDYDRDKEMDYMTNWMA